MFQSSRIASGSWRLQASSACSPSSASTIWNSSPSRIRRATLRMTLESSTTKHVFIVVPHSVYLQVPSYKPFRILKASRRDWPCSAILAADIENAVDIDHHQQ